ncbi:hypothetical protein SBADM41S_10425 [Streptomyces badius]
MRALRILLVLVVVLGGLFLAVDRAAVWFAESEAEDRVTISGGGPATTDISIKGFPFLTQLAGSKLDRVDVNLTGMKTSAAGRTIRVSEVRARLHVKLAIQGSVTRDGEPVTGYVRLLDSTGEFTAEVPTSATGQFRFYAAEGTWTLRALVPGGSADRTVVAQTGGLSEVAIAV